MGSVEPERLRVAVIGAGIGGLAMAKQQRDRTPDAEIVVFEVRRNVGGIWNYEEDAGVPQTRFDEEGRAQAANVWVKGDVPKEEEVPPSPVYPTLKTNLHKDLMTFRGEPYPPGTSPYPPHCTILAYLENYAAKHDLISLIRFHTRVTRVRHSAAAEGAPRGRQRWLVESAGADGVSREETFDAVAVATGHFATPHFPFVSGLWDFEGEVTHARWWRGPEKYRGKTVVVVGSHASGSDLVRELAWLNVPASPAPSNPFPSPYLPASTDPSRLPRARIVQALRHDPPPWNDRPAPKYLDEIEKRGEIVEVVGRTISFKSGEKVEGVDAIIFATGYRFSYPFLRAFDPPFDSHPVIRSVPSTQRAEPGTVPESTVVARPDAQGLFVDNLSKHHLFYRPDPTLTFIGLPQMIAPFPLWETQARVAAYLFAFPPSAPIPAGLLEPPKQPQADEHEGTAEEDVVKRTHYLDPPAEFDVADELLRLIGEGGEEHGTPVGKEKAPWSKTPQWKRDLRAQALDSRRRELGY